MTIAYYHQRLYFQNRLKVYPNLNILSNCKLKVPQSVYTLAKDSKPAYVLSQRAIASVITSNFANYEEDDAAISALTFSTYRVCRASRVAAHPRRWSR